MCVTLCMCVCVCVYDKWMQNDFVVEKKKIF